MRIVIDGRVACTDALRVYSPQNGRNPQEPGYRIKFMPGVIVFWDLPLAMPAFLIWRTYRPDLRRRP